MQTQRAEMALGIWMRYQVLGELEEQARAKLCEFAQQYLSMPVSVQVRVAVGKPADQILRVAQEAGVDLIVMGTHGRTGWRHAVLGSAVKIVLALHLLDLFAHGAQPLYHVLLGLYRAISTSARAFKCATSLSSFARRSFDPR